MTDPPLPVATLADLSAFSHFVASRQGLFVAGLGGVRLFAPGSYFGITVRRDNLYAFEHRHRSDAPTRTGRILRFGLNAGEPSDRQQADLVVGGLDNGCHQIDFLGGRLHVVDTYRQRLLVLERDGRIIERAPLPPVGRGEPGYVHVNSITARGGVIHLLLHHGGRQDSEILRLDERYREIDRVVLKGTGCHNVVVLEDGELLSCGSPAGALISDRGLERPMLPGLMTRGLSVDPDGLSVGSSLFGPRQIRRTLPGVVSFLDRNYRVVAHVAVPGSPTDIRRIDGNDLSLADYSPSPSSSRCPRVSGSRSHTSGMAR